MRRDGTGRRHGGLEAVSKLAAAAKIGVAGNHQLTSARRGAPKALSAGPASDWSERRTHLAGAVRVTLAAPWFELGWITRRRDIRALLISDNGKRGFGKTFGIDRVA